MYEINNINVRLQAVRRYINYILAAVAILVLTGVIVFAAAGYDIDRQTGQVIQNGILLVETEPRGATVTINSVTESARTPAKYPIPEGNYTVLIEREGYRSWQQDVQVVGSQVTWLYYPRLVPQIINTRSIAQLPNLSFVGEIAARDQIVVGSSVDLRSLNVFDMGAQEVVAQPLVLPDSLFVFTEGDEPTARGSMEFVHASNDGRYVVLRYTHSSQTDLVVVDLNAPQNSVNLDIRFGREFDEVVIPAVGRFVANTEGLLFSGELSDAELALPVSNATSSLVAFDGDVWYVQDLGDRMSVFTIANTDQAVVESRAEELRIAVSDHDGRTYLALISDVRVNVFFDPVVDPTQSAIADKVLAIEDMSDVQISPEGRFIAVIGANNSDVYDFETLQTYSVAHGSSERLSWLDGHRLSYDIDGQLHITDFFGGNDYQIASADAGQPLFTNEDRSAIFSINTSDRTRQVFLRSSSLETN